MGKGSAAPIDILDAFTSSGGRHSIDNYGEIPALSGIKARKKLAATVYHRTILTVEAQNRKTVAPVAIIIILFLMNGGLPLYRLDSWMHCIMQQPPTQARGRSRLQKHGI
jgi:hypothetical protein